MGMAARMIQATFIRPSRDESKGLVNRQNRCNYTQSYVLLWLLGQEAQTSGGVLWWGAVVGWVRAGRSGWKPAVKVRLALPCLGFALTWVTLALKDTKQRLKSPPASSRKFGTGSRRFDVLDGSQIVCQSGSVHAGRWRATECRDCSTCSACA